MSNIVIKAISQEDVAAIFKGNADAIYSIIEDSFKKYLADDIIMSDKISAPAEVELLYQFGADIGLSEKEVSDAIAMSIQKNYIPSINALC
jgi:hypothetical protein